MQKTRANDYIYVVLVKALTGLGKIARTLKKYEYTHIAVCLDSKLDKFYTFSRRKHYDPFDCGYMVETMDCYVFGKNKSVKLKIFKIPVTRDKKLEIEEYINKIANDQKYVFNFFSMLTMPIFHGFRIYKAHNCMSFVSKIIDISNSVLMEKEYYKYDILEIDNLLSKYFYKEDLFYANKINKQDYMKYIGIIKNIYHFLKLNGILFFRLFFKRVKDDQ